MLDIPRMSLSLRFFLNQNYLPSLESASLRVWCARSLAAELEAGVLGVSGIGVDPAEMMLRIRITDQVEPEILTGVYLLKQDQMEGSLEKLFDSIIRTLWAGR